MVVESNPHLDFILGPQNYHAGFSLKKLMTIINYCISDNWVRGMLKEAGADDKVLNAFDIGVKEFIKAIETVLHVNTKRPRERSVAFKKQCNKEYWSLNGEGTRAMRIVERERDDDPYISAIELAEVLTEERVLTFRGRTTLPINRTDDDYKWSNQQVYNLLNLMNLAIRKRPKSIPQKRRARLSKYE